MLLWIGLSVCLTEATMVISVWVLWVPTPDPVSQLERQKMEGRGHRGRFVFHSPCSPLSCLPSDHLPSQLKGMFVLHICLCSQMIFCNKTQTFWYFLDSWVMTLRFALLGLWLFPVENVACRNYCSCFLVCLWDEMKNRLTLADVPPATIKSRPTVC